MIHVNRTVTVGNQESIIDSPIILYRGDREVEVEFTINGNKFAFTNGGNVIKSANAAHGQLVINTPTGEYMFSKIKECKDGKIIFTITKEMIDELVEVGFYSFQIRLFDGSQVSRVTIPPVFQGIDIRNPIAAEDETNAVDIGLVDYATVQKDEYENLVTFLPDGSYNKTDWESKGLITEAKLDKIEDALYTINKNMEESDLSIFNRLENINQNVNRQITDFKKEIDAEIEEFEGSIDTDVEQFKIDTNAAIADYKNEVNEELGYVKNSVKIYPLLDKEVELMNYYNLDMTLFDVKEPYCSVDRYGGDNTGTRCSSDSIQIAVDMAEYLCINGFLHNPITFNSGVYRMKKTVLIKKSMSDTLKETPIVLKGSCSRIHTHSSKGHTTLRIEIPNHIGKDYANAFAINVTYSDFIERNDETDSFVYSDSGTTDGGFTLFPIINHIEFSDLAFYTDRSQFNVNIIKGYRYRSKIENIEVNGANRLIFQPIVDINGNGNYCDFSHYYNLNFNYMKKNGLELSHPDNSLIEEVTCHRLGKDASELIRVVDGGGFKISRVHYAYSFEDGTTTPRNDGTGKNGDTCIILLNGCSAVKIENMYIERSLKDYVIRLYNTKSIEISNTNEMFFGNGFLKIQEKCHGINIHDIYRNCNLVNEYDDIFIADNTVYSNLRITNFLCRNFYSNTINLEFDDFASLTGLDGKEKNYRSVNHNINLVNDSIVQCDELTLNIAHYNGVTTVRNANDKYLDYPITFNDGAIVLNDYISNVIPSVSSTSTLIPYICCVDSANRKQIIFIDGVTNQKVTELDNRIRCDVKIRTLNKYLFN